MLRQFDKNTILKEIQKTPDIFGVLCNIQRVADNLQYPCYVVGGYVRDLILGRPNDDIDVVVVGKGQKIAEAFTEYLKRESNFDNIKLSIFENFGTAQVHFGNWEVEFVGARKESYERGSRKPIVEDGTLEDDQLRRDFTINAMAIQLNADHFGELVDPFNGIEDLKNKIIRTPIDPDTTFSDDPLRMLRAVRFMCKFDFGIDQKTQDGIIRNVDRLDIISAERITTEFMKIMASDHAKDGIEILKNFGLLKKFLPELVEMDTTRTSTVSENVRGHKNIFQHTLFVLDNVAQQSDNVWLRIAALFHDIGKMKTRSWNAHKGWSFDNHEYVGAKMIKSIFSRMKMPLDENMSFVETMVRMHMRPQAICDEGVTDAAVRRLVNDANGYIDELLILAKADITTKHEDKKKNFWKQYDELKQRIEDLKQKDYVRLFQPCVSGDDIMIRYHLTPSRQVGEIKQLIKDAVLDNIVENTPDALYKYIDEHYKF